MRVSHASINILKQSLSEVIQRPKYGTGGLASSTVTINDTTLKTANSISGKGLVHVVYWEVGSITGSPTTEETLCTFFVDDAEVDLVKKIKYANNDFDRTTPYQQILRYTAGGVCGVQLTPPTGFTFESSAVQKVQGQGTVDATNYFTMDCRVIYQLV